ncbi:MAG: transglycosylase domain-containing protein, partial [Lachnospiraceae bacterium]|nr:transglycosylase domain-containing protein [Lachnospiraceae bacterium]
MSYSKHETVKKQRKLVSKTQRNTRKILVSFFKVFLVLVVTVVIACAGAGFGMMKGVLDNAPDVNEISIVPKGFKTTLYDKDGNVEKEFSTYGSNREYVYYEDIPEDFINAVVAIEDQRYWTHNGIDVKGILRAGVRGIASGSFDEGASTITQQLIKNHVFNVGMDERTFLDSLERKIQEQYLALELEKIYTKEQIIEYYLNTIYLGRGAHGIQAASELYFGKSMDQLTISEIAVIAGITKNPSQFDPVIFPEENAKRRVDVLDKMLELEYITQAQYEVAMADEVYDRIKIEYDNQQASDTVYTYYEDAIYNQLRNDLMELYGCTEDQAAMMIYTEGYSIYSVQDKEIQAICDAVINDDSYVYSASKVGLDYKLTILDGDGVTEHNYMIGHVVNYFVNATGNDKYKPIYNTEEEARAAADTFREAMLIETNGTFIAEDFDVSPQPQFSFTIMDHKTGYVKAMVGGKGEKTADLSFNRATDAPRQPGSTFKILAAYLPLFDTGIGSLAKVYKDEPYYYKNGGYVGNWYGGYRGYCNCREGIAQSMNILAVKAITDATEEVAFEYLMKLGFTTLVDQEVAADGSIYSDITQSTALGGLTYGVTTYEMTAAYGAIANGGIYTKPVL